MSDGDKLLFGEDELFGRPEPRPPAAARRRGRPPRAAAEPPPPPVPAAPPSAGPPPGGQPPGVSDEAAPGPAAPGGDSTPPPPAAAPHLEDGPLRRLVDSNFLQYASYVIRDRAIPDLDDGLKPVQRRILFSLHEIDDGKFIKVANVVGYTMQYHPHGDASIADALVGLTNKNIAIEGQGNFGNPLTGDPAAASRYIECRLTPLAKETLFNDDLTRFVPSYDGRRKEPVTLPVKLPLLLMTGAEGIAVGLSTKLLPHNPAELWKAQIAILQKKPFSLAPDFPQGGLMDASEYERGNGRVRVRAQIEKRDGDRLMIREIPAGTTTDSLIASIEDAARKKKVHIRSIQDYTAEKVEIEIQLGAGENADKAIRALYAFTQCEQSISCRALVIHRNRPLETDVHRILEHNTKRLVEILEAELRLERQRLTEEIHRKTLVEIFIENRIYERIEKCDTSAKVHQAVFDGVNEFRRLLRRDVTKDDVEMLLGIPIRRISLFDRRKNEEEIADLEKQLKQVESDLAAVVPFSIKYLKNLLKEHGDRFPRRTRLATFENIEIRELTASELTVRYDREKGYLGHEVEGEELFACSSLDKIAVVWKSGVYKVMPPPDKLFVDGDVLHVAVYDRDAPMTVVYTHDHISYLKRFRFGGAIQNKEYRCAPEGAEIRHFDAAEAGELYVRYWPQKRLRILQQVFHAGEVAVRGADSRGIQMTTKPIRSIAKAKPRNWDDEDTGPRGVLFDFAEKK